MNNDPAFNENIDPEMMQEFNRSQEEIMQEEVKMENQVKQEIMDQYKQVMQDGQVDVKIYDQANQLTSAFRLKTGDVLVLQRGGHSFEFTKDTRIIEVKQGPYMGLDEKEFF